MDKKFIELSPKWQWFLEIAKEIGHGEATVKFFNGEPAEVLRAIKQRNYAAETRK